MSTMMLRRMSKSCLLRRMFNSSSQSPIQVSAEISAALKEGKPVVALESTIVAHGMPWPQNYEAVLKVEETIRNNGAIPATIAVLKGIPTVGLNNQELEYLAKSGSNIMKCSTRELPLVMASKRDGATTVASTARLATMCGINVFVTGGIGGVHRDGNLTFDISADLLELKSNPIIVVCAGIKSILDIGLTLEYLETLGVPVISYQTNEFPAFFTPYSEYQTPCRLDSPIEIANHYLNVKLLNLNTGTLIACPNPHPANGEEVEHAIQDALKSAHEEGIKGAATTPYVLKYVAEKTGGKSLEANIALVLNNAMIGAQIACELANMQK